MAHRELVWTALEHYRNRGASAEEIRGFVAYRAPESEQRDDQTVLDQLVAREDVMLVGARYYLTPAAYRRARGSALAGEWAFSDAWILLAILMSKDETTVPELLPVADYINHAIPSEHEMHGALNRLVAAKLIRVRKSGIVATDAARALEGKAHAAAGRAVLGRCDALRRLLACPHCGVTLSKVRWRRYTRTEDWARNDSPRDQSSEAREMS